MIFKYMQYNNKKLFPLMFILIRSCFISKLDVLCYTRRMNKLYMCAFYSPIYCKPPQPPLPPHTHLLTFCLFFFFQSFSSVLDSSVSLFPGGFPLNLPLIASTKGILTNVFKANINHTKNHRVKL